MSVISKTRFFKLVRVENICWIKHEFTATSGIKVEETLGFESPTCHKNQKCSIKLPLNIVLNTSSRFTSDLGTIINTSLTTELTKVL